MSISEDVQAFGAEVRRRRKGLGWTLPKLAKRSGLTPNFIGAMELGLREPSLSTMLKIAKGFNVPLSELLGGGGLSPAALECCRLLKEAPQDVGDALKDILKCYSGNRRR